LGARRRFCQNWYCLSKTQAEREALAYGEKAGTTTMDVVTVCPPWVLGPLLQPTVNTTSMRLVAYLTGSSISTSLLAADEHLDSQAGGGNSMIRADEYAGENTDEKMRNMVDVRDVVAALVLALETPEASGRRLICSAHAMKVSETVGLVRSLHPDLKLDYPRK
jgi:nucleoside-diphosphate-sugar epimerase